MLLVVLVFVSTEFSVLASSTVVVVPAVLLVSVVSGHWQLQLVAAVVPVVAVVVVPTAAPFVLVVPVVIALVVVFVVAVVVVVPVVVSEQPDIIAKIIRPVKAFPKVMLFSPFSNNKFVILYDVIKL